MVLSIILITILIIIITYYYLFRNNNYWKNKGIAYEKSVPFLGSLMSVALLRKSEGEYVNDLYRKYKGEKIVGFTGFNNRPGLVIRDPNIIHKVLIKDFHYFANNDNSFFDDELDPIVARGLIFQKGEKWKKSKAILTPIFTAGKVKTLYPQMAAVAEELVDYLKLQKGELHVEEVILRYTGEIVARCAFSIDGRSFHDSDPLMKRLGKALFNPGKCSTFKILTIMLAPSIGKLLKFRLLTKEAAKIFTSLLSDVISYRKEHNEIRHDFLQHLLDIKERVSVTDDYTDNDITAACVMFFVEAYEASAIVLSHVLYNLALNKDVQDKAYREISESLQQNKTWSFDVISALPYLDSLLLETHRIYPVTFGLKRVCTERYLMDVGKETPLVVEKDTRMFVPTYAIHNDELFWDDAKKFKPERFGNNEHVSLKTRGIFLPFGDGPRMCIGIRVAQILIKVALVHIIQNFEVLPSERTSANVELDPTIFDVVNQKNGLYLKFLER